jgi:hypothetical protein
MSDFFGVSETDDPSLDTANVTKTVQVSQATIDYRVARWCSFKPKI